MNPSIRNRLLFILLTIISGVWMIVTLQIYVETQHEVEELFDANLAQNAKALYELLRHELQEEDEEEERENYDEFKLEIEDLKLAHPYEHKITFLVRTRSGKIVASSSNTPIFSIPDNPSNEFYNDYPTKQHLWRVFTLKRSEIIIQTAERYDIRNELIRKIISAILIILLLALPFLTISMWLSVGRSFRPLNKVAQDIAIRTPDQLQPLDTENIPKEIKILVESLNSLLIRLERAFENERRFTADAAHELRTPLSGLKIQAQVAQRASDPVKRQQALQYIISGVDRTTRLVTQLLTLARMDATQTLTMQPVDLLNIVQQVIIDLTPQAWQKTIDLGMEDCSTERIVVGNQEALYILVSNFVDNAIRYTPTGGQITVTLHNRPPNWLRLAVIDTGPGIPMEQRDKVFERFYRVEKTIPGSGLGLSIAHRIAQLHHLSIQLLDTTSNQGLCVQLDFQNIRSVPTIHS